MIPTFTAEAALREAQGRYRTSASPLPGWGHEVVTALEFGGGPFTSTPRGGSTQTAGQHCFQFCAQHYVRDTNCPLEYVKNFGWYRPTHCWREVCDTYCVPRPA